MAAEVLIPTTEKELVIAFKKSLDAQQKIFVLGKGSNVLFKDEGFCGVVLKNTRACMQLRLLPGRFGFFRSRRRVYVGSSVPNQKLIRFCALHHLDAPVYLQTVPGNIGGAIFMNAGTGRAEARYFAEYVLRVRVFDGETVRWLSAEDCDFEYRHSCFMSRRLLILGCEIECRRREGKKTIEAVATRTRFAKQVQDHSYPNAGSVFNRGYFDFPEVRGMQEGGARFSEKTCNWIVNTDNASSADVMNLIHRAREVHRIFRHE